MIAAADEAGVVFMVVTVSFRIPQEEKERLEAISAKVHQSKSVLLRKAVREYLDEMEDVLIALEPLPRDDRTS